MKKSDYLQTLKELKDALPSDAAPAAPAAPVAAQPTDSQPDDAPAPAPVTERQPEAPAPTAATPSQPASTSTPTDAELFPGYNALPEDSRAAIKARWDLAAGAEAAKQELERKNREYNMLHNRLAPTQQQLSRQQLENTRLQQEVNKFRENTSKTANGALRQRIDAMKEQFPDDAAMWEATLAEVEGAKSGYAEFGEKLQRLEQREYLNEQKQALSSVHPDWQKMTAKVQQGEDGNYAVRRTIDTPEAQEFEVWANNLDPYERNTIWPLFKSTNATDAIYVLNRFKHDQAIARLVAGQTQQQEPTAPPAIAAPAPDPDPSRRTTAQPLRAAGQPKSDKQRELIAAADLLRKQGKLPPLPQQRRA